MRGVLAGLPLAAVAVVVCGCGARAKLPLDRWLSFSAARRNATITLIPAYNGANGGFNFNGYAKGQVAVVVPVGWRVTVRCKTSPGERHSCAVRPSPGTTSPPIPGAAGRRTFSFSASAPGVYRMLSPAPADARTGMWDVLEVRRVSRPKVVLLRSGS